LHNQAIHTHEFLVHLFIVSALNATVILSHDQEENVRHRFNLLIVAVQISNLGYLPEMQVFMKITM